MTNSWLLLLMLFAITFGCRVLPFVLGKKLEKISLLQKLSTTLPMCILILLVAHTLHVGTCSLPEILALGACLLMQWAFRKVLLSMGVAVAIQQLLIALT